MFGLLFDLANTAISVVLPLLATYKAVQQHDRTLLAKADLKPWCLYWLMYALVATVEARLGFLLQYFPFFGLVKLYLSLWLILPQTQGAHYLYYVYIEPFLSHHEATIESALRCADPRELLRVVSNYFGLEINLSRFAAATASPSPSSPTGSYLDQLVDSFVKPSASNNNINNNTAVQGGLAESLLGVIKAFPLGSSSRAESVGSKALGTPQKSFDSLKSFDSSPSAIKSSSSEGSDFDVVGKEDLVNFVENVAKGVSSSMGSSSTDKSGAQSSGWFGWWSQDKPKKA